MDRVEIFIYPTDTVWGIGASIFDKKSNDEITKIKKTKQGKPLTVLFSSFSQLCEYFSFPEGFDLSNFFSLEVTVGIPISWLKRDVPSWVSSMSDFLCVRILDLKFEKRFLDKMPLTTTSLNLTGENPIVHFQDAFQFYEAINSEGIHFIKLQTGELSGNSSTIIIFKEDLSFSFLREGRLFKKVLSCARLLST